MTGLSQRYDDDDLLTDLQVRGSRGSEGPNGQVGQGIRKKITDNLGYDDD